MQHLHESFLNLFYLNMFAMEQFGECIWDLIVNAKNYYEVEYKLR